MITRHRAVVKRDITSCRDGRHLILYYSI